MAWNSYRAKAESMAGQHFFATWSVKKKLLVSLIPSIALILAVTGYVTNWFSAKYLNQSLHRTAQAQNLAQARDLEWLLEFHRRGLLTLAHSGRVGRADLEAAFAQWSVYHPGIVSELCHVGLNAADTLLLVANAGRLEEVPRELHHDIKNSPAALAQKVRELKPGSAHLSRLTEVVYPPSAMPGSQRTRVLSVYRILTPVFDAQMNLSGHLVVSLDAQAMRNTLSLFNSPKSPLFSFARTSETRFSFFFDDQGWMLFQSENVEDPAKDLSVEIARLGMTGDYGIPEYDKAFRPATRHESYWRMVVEVQANRQGIMEAQSLPTADGVLSDQHFLVYTPVRFRTAPDKDAEVIGGVAYVDRSRLTDAAEFRHLDVMAVITLAAMGIIGVLIIFVSRIITKPMLTLAAEIGNIFETQSLRPVQLAKFDKESMVLCDALNRMILAIQDKQEQIRQRDEHIEMVAQREKVSFDSETPTSVGWRLVGEIPDLIGNSQGMASLQSMILKAASTEADVLIVGETGTGKELTAEGIHKFSSRVDAPFISINCGGLDENLLLDTLFGHVKGAFTEARNDRKGAFLAADGGTLFLDEIGTASAKVQKSLLRALSVRRIRPLGSDQEIEFNVRVIAATNVDLMELVQRGEFRDDLYYRLKVISIQTPTLRQRKDDIPLLASHFMKEAAALSRRGEVGLSRGALEKLMAHNWPGNVRELKNCITRALAFAEGEVLYAEDVVFDDASLATLPHVPAFESQGQSPGAGYQESAPPAQPRQPERPEPPTTTEASTARAFSPRHAIALGLARERGSFTRMDYQNALGKDVSQRTAQYDLQSLVQSGLLQKSGKGPSTLYILSGAGNARA